MCKAGAGLRVTHDPIPDDAEAVGARYDAVRDLWEIALESRAFAAVGEGRAYPVLPPPRFERIGP
jgi:hypothetical protein